MKNRYDVRSFVASIIINSPKYGVHETLISIDKIERAKEFPGTWNIRKSRGDRPFYVIGNMPRIDGKQEKVLLHRWLTNAPKEMVIDHIDGDTLNNTDENLRIIKQSENCQNKKGAQSNSSSGIRGVSWEKDREKWHVQIGINKKIKHIGYFKNIEEAERAAVEARMEYMPFSNESIRCKSERVLRPPEGLAETFQR